MVLVGVPYRYMGVRKYDQHALASDPDLHVRLLYILSGSCCISVSYVRLGIYSWLAGSLLPSREAYYRNNGVTTTSVT